MNGEETVGAPRPPAIRSPATEFAGGRTAVMWKDKKDANHYL